PSISHRCVSAVMPAGRPEPWRCAMHSAHSAWPIWKPFFVRPICGPANRKGRRGIMSEIDLPGCTPGPLMSYLKALGVFRLVAEQSDREAKLSWCGGAARLHTKLDRAGLEKFFREQYRPTPIVGPWGARSGFYPGSSESSARDALDGIVNAAETDSRLTA